MNQNSSRMIVFILIIWWASLCRAWEPPWQDKYNNKGDKGAPCSAVKDWRHPGWHFFNNSHIGLFNNENRPWRHPLNDRFIRTPQFPADVALPNPLLPTNDIGTLKLYHQAMVTLVEDENTSAADKDRAAEMYTVDMYCWERLQDCQSSGWVASWFWWSCKPNLVATNLYNWWSQESKNLDAITLSLLQRSNRYALLELSHKLAPFIKQIGNWQPLSKRQYQSFKDGGVIVPKFAIYSQPVLDHFLDPVHQQDCLDVRRPHLRDHIIPPEPLLSTVDNVFSKTNKTLITLYHDALMAYDKDFALTVRERQKKQARFNAESWEWIIHDACFYNREACNIEDFYGRLNSNTWFSGHIEAATRFKKQMEEQGLVELGGLLLDEVKRCHGTRADIDQLLGEFLYH